MQGLLAYKVQPSDERQSVRSCARIPNGLKMDNMNPTQAIATLTAAGLTEKDIGAQVGANQKTINRYRRGQREPAWEMGVALISLAEQVTNDPSVVSNLKLSKSSS